MNDKEEAPTSGPPVFDLIRYIQKQIAWSALTFGPGDNAIGLVKHIRQECDELDAAPHDLEEWIDVIILALDGAWRTGATPATVTYMLQYKQDKNLKRRWSEPKAGEPCNHID